MSRLTAARAGRCGSLGRADDGWWRTHASGRCARGRKLAVVGIVRVSDDAVAEVLVSAVSEDVTCPAPFEEVVWVVRDAPDLKQLREDVEVRLRGVATDWGDHLCLTFHPV